MARIWLDFRFALRNLRRSPLFALVATASLAVGIGANTAIFTLIDQLLLRLLPVRNPEQLVMIWSTGPHLGNNRGARASSYPMYQDYQRRAPAFSHVFCRYQTSASLTFNGQTERVYAELVSGNYFQALGVLPAAGRLFTPEQDDRTYKGHPAVVLSYPYWISRFAGDPNVVGRKISVNNYPMTIVGVSADGFLGLDPAHSPQIRVPIQMKPIMTPGWDDLGNRRSQWIQIFARMKPGYTLASAQASLQPLFHQILVDELAQPEMRDASEYSRKRFLARQVRLEAAGSGYSPMRQSYSTPLIVLMCMVGLVLLIACFNVANLLIAQTMARQKELAVRLAVGASRSQIVVQLLLESLLLSAAGGVAGLLLSMGMIRGLLRFLPKGDYPLMLRTEPDLRILAFNTALALLTGMLFGLAPALQSMRVELWSTLKDVVGAMGGSSSSARLRRLLVVAQITCSFVLLAGAGLFVKTLANLKSAHSGFRDIENIVTFQVDPALNGYSVARMQQFYQRLLEEIRSVPGVRSAAIAIVPVLRASEWDSTMSVEGHQAKDGEDMQAFMNAVSSGYWQTMGEPLLAGRDFDERDQGDSITVAIVNRKFAAHFFGAQNPIGRHIGFGSGPHVKRDIEIIGVVEDSLYEGPREGVHRQVFVPLRQGRSPASASFYVRTSLDSKTLFSTLRAKVRALDSSMPVYAMRTLEGQLDETLSTERLIAVLSSVFGAVAALLAALGLYGVLALVVTRRTKEIGLRMALGASRMSVIWMVLREALGLFGIGLAVGAPAEFALNRYISAQLFGIQPTDPWTLALAVTTLLGAVLGAGWLPARRASTVDPIRALRYE
jgi:predicted permease